MNEDQEADECDHADAYSIPFPVLESQGGIYDDESYWSGWHAGRMAQLLEFEVDDEIPDLIHVDDVFQADLIGMHNKYVMQVCIQCMEGTHDESEEASEWMSVRFLKQADVDEDDVNDYDDHEDEEGDE